MGSFSADDLVQHAAAMRSLARDLLGDDALADDALQQARLAALRRPPAQPVAVGAWLRAVVRRCAVDIWRSERRRRAREVELARAEAFEPPDATELLEVQQDVVAAVRALDEPYRIAVWLRYYEDLPPAAIALRTGEPVKTIKTRLWRALQLLRARLDARHGERADERGGWAFALLPLARDPARATSTAAALAAGVTWMSAKVLLGSFAVIALAAGAWWLGVSDPAPRGPEPSPPIAAAPANAANAPIAASAPSPERTAPPAPALDPAADVSAYGALRVRVSWHDGTPAADVAIDATAHGEPQVDRNELRFVSDAAGLAEAPRVHAGRVALTSDRGGEASADVRGGATTEVEFRLPRGVDVAGVVVDDRRRPVADAEVVVVSPHQGWRGGRTLARSDSNGAFALRAIDVRWSIGARAAGFAPSLLVDLEEVTSPANDGTPMQVTLVVTLPGATVVGKVVDDAGVAIAGALVVLGRGAGGHYEPPRIRETWSPHVVTTGADGAFRCDGIAPGEHPIVARADGCTRASKDVVCVGGETTSVRLVLSFGFAVRGTARDETGAAAAGAIVTTIDSLDFDGGLDFATRERTELKRPRVVADAAGAFELRAVRPGTAHVIAAVQDASGQFLAYSQTTVTGQVGDALTWDPVLLGGKTLRVRIVDTAGAPVQVGHGVYAVAERPAGARSHLTAMPSFKQPGVIEFVGCADVPYTVSTNVDDEATGARHWPYVTGAMPGGPDVELRVPARAAPQPPGTVTCRIVDRSGRARSHPFKVSLASGTATRHSRRDGDRFVIDDVAPGRHFLWVRAGEVPLHIGERFEVQPSQTVDLGDVVIAPRAALRVALRASGGASIEKPAASIDENYHRVPLSWNGTHLVTDDAPTGRHRLILRMMDWFAAPRTIELLAGEETLVDVDVVPGCLRRVRLALPLPDRWNECVLVVRDARGAEIATESIPPSHFGAMPAMWNVVLPLQPLVLEAALDGSKHSWPIDCRDPETAARAFRFSLR